MLAGRRLELLERRSGHRFKGYTPIQELSIPRPCRLRNVEDTTRPQYVYPTPEKRSPEMRVISLILADQTDSQRKIVRPRRMPSYCSQHRDIYKKIHRNDSSLFDDDFLVRGFEMTTDSAKKRDSPFDHIDANERRTTDSEAQTSEDDEENFACFEKGIEIQLTDCCQCVCDLFDNGFRSKLNYQEYGFLPTDDLSSVIPSRSREVKVTPKNNILDPDILKIIRVTMNTKH